MTGVPPVGPLQAGPPATSGPITAGEWIGLIAGNGSFPALFADNVRRLGYRVSAVALTGETEAALEGHVDRIHWISLGQLGKLIKAFKQDGVHQAVMLGGVSKTHLFTKVRFDFRALALARRLDVRKDDVILRALAAELEGEGISIREPMFGLKGLTMEEGTAVSARTDQERVARHPVWLGDGRGSRPLGYRPVHRGEGRCRRGRGSRGGY